MVRKWITIAMCAAIPAGMAGEPSLEEVMQKLELLQQQVRQQQMIIEELRQEGPARQTAEQTQDVKEVVKKEVAEALDKHALSAASDAPYLRLGSNIDGIKVTGDLRLRYEYRDRSDQGNSNRDRMRTRFRIGGIWENSTESWEIGAGLATGGTDPTSTNDTWSQANFFETGNINLDYAYAKHKTEYDEIDISLTLGQHKNPFVSSWLLWDSDVRPAGFSLQAEYAGLFGTLGYYDVYNAGNEIVEMWGAQLGYAFDTDMIDGMIAAAYYTYNDSTFKDARGTGAWGYPGPVNSSFDIQIADLYGEISMPLGEVAKLKLLANYFVNLGASGDAGEGYYLDPNIDASSEDDGWLAGAELSLGPGKLSYYYAGLSENSANPMLVDSDFGTGLGGVDVEAHRFKASYKITKNASVGVLAQFAEAMERSNVGDVELYMLDMSYKF